MLKIARVGTLVAALVAALLSQISGSLAKELVVGGKDYTEQLLMTELTSQLLTSRGFKVTTRSEYDTPGVRRAQEDGQVDIYWEYTGTSLREFNKITEKLGPDESYQRVRQLDMQKGLIWLQPSRVNNTYALAMRRADATAKKIATISDLAATISDGDQLVFASGPEFYERSDGLRPLQQAYGFEFGRGRVLRLDSELIPSLLRDLDLVHVGMVFATDGRLSAYDLIILEDDRKFFPNYAMAPVVRKESLDAHPEIAGYLGSLAATLDNDTMARLNAKVDLGRASAREVASEFLKSHRLF